jgi:hypothetical protein
LWENFCNVNLLYETIYFEHLSYYSIFSNFPKILNCTDYWHDNP